MFSLLLVYVFVDHLLVKDRVSICSWQMLSFVSSSFAICASVCISLVSMPSSKSIRLLVSLLFGLSVSISVPVSIVFKGMEYVDS